MHSVPLARAALLLVAVTTCVALANAADFRPTKAWARQISTDEFYADFTVSPPTRTMYVSRPVGQQNSSYSNASQVALYVAVEALDALTGRLLWRVKLPHSNTSVDAISVSHVVDVQQDVVVVSMRQVNISRARLTGVAGGRGHGAGKVLWQIEAPLDSYYRQTGRAVPTVGGRSVFAALSRSFLQVDTLTGEVLGSAKLPPANGYETAAVSYATLAGSTDERVFATAALRHLHAYGPAEEISANELVAWAQVGLPGQIWNHTIRIVRVQGVVPSSQSSSADLNTTTIFTTYSSLDTSPVLGPWLTVTPSTEASTGVRVAVVGTDANGNVVTVDARTGQGISSNASGVFVGTDMSVVSPGDGSLPIAIVAGFESLAVVSPSTGAQGWYDSFSHGQSMDGLKYPNRLSGVVPLNATVLASATTAFFTASNFTMESTTPVLCAVALTSGEQHGCIDEPFTTPGGDDFGENGYPVYAIEHPHRPGRALVFNHNDSHVVAWDADAGTNGAH